MSKLSNVYKNISIDIWNRMKFSLETNSKISETTLTENLLFMINKHRVANKDNSIRIYESKDEKTNGNDLEIYLEITKNKYILLAVQAKKLYTKEQKYKAISHKVGTNFQIDLLLNYARSKDGLPLYLLYNYVPNCTRKNKELFGCTLIKASHIKAVYYPKTKKRWIIPSFNNLHRCNHKSCAVPWHLLASNKFFKSCVEYYNASNTQQLKEYKQNEIIGDEWIEVEEYAGYEHVVIETEKVDFKNLEYDFYSQKRFFKPKFKMVISLEKNNKNEEAR